MIIIELISDICTIGGGQTLTKNLAISISKQRKDVKIILVSLYDKSESPIVTELEKQGITIIYLNKKRGFDLMCAKRLRKIINEINPDVIHAHLSVILTIYLSKIYKKHSIYYTFHSVASKSTSFSEMINNHLTMKMIKKRHLVPIAISKIVANTISDYFNIEYPVVIHNGVDTDTFRPKDNFFNREYDFAVVGSFSNVKNQKQILNIFYSVYKKEYFFKAVFLGDGPLKEECQSFVRNNNFNDLIEFKGNVSDTFNYLNNSYFLVMKSLYEGNPMVINEAIACGTYIVSNNVGGIPDIVDDSTGRIVDKNDDNAFEEAIVDSLRNKNFVLKNVQTQLDKNRKRVSIDNVSTLYLKLFEGKHDEQL